MKAYCSEYYTLGSRSMDQGVRYSDLCLDPIVLRLCAAVAFLLFHAVMLFHVSLWAFLILAKDV